MMQLTWPWRRGSPPNGPPKTDAGARTCRRKHLAGGERQPA
jgi:hypothetical protein